MIKMSRVKPYHRLDGNDTCAKEKENLGQKQVDSIDHFCGSCQNTHGKLQEQIPQNTESITLLTSQSRIQSKKLLKLHKHRWNWWQGGIDMASHNRRDKSSVPCLNCGEKGNYANEPKKCKSKQVKEKYERRFHKKWYPQNWGTTNTMRMRAQNLTITLQVQHWQSHHENNQKFSRSRVDEF